METLDQYVMIGGPPAQVWNESITSDIKQFLMSWYIFFFQMPFMPEYTTTLFDFKFFKAMKQSEEDLEAYKYVFSKKGALTGPINYYRAAAKFLFPDPPLQRPQTFARGLFMLGESDKYISRASGKEAQKYYDNLEFKIIEGANHFAQQHQPEATNRLIREFIERK
jgi:epoxide hydrolase 4